VTLSILSRINLLYSCYLANSQGNRPVYQAIRRCQARKILEVGLATGDRALEMIKIAKLASPGHEIHYVGVDRFEDRSESDGPGLTFKQAHQLLRIEGVRVQLMPGNHSDVLVRIANSLGKVDLLIVPAELDCPSFARLWFFVPRMLHENSLVFVERLRDDGQKVLEIKARDDMERLAAAGSRRHAA
jgi:hypothetical protein